jgi:hypothetical protein
MAKKKKSNIIVSDTGLSDFGAASGNDSDLIKQLPKSFGRGSSNKTSQRPSGVRGSMSKTPDLRSSSNTSMIRPRNVPTVDPKYGVISPSLVMVSINPSPTGLEDSIIASLWSNVIYKNQLSKLNLTTNGSRVPIDINATRNYFTGISEIIAAYIQLSSIRQLCEDLIAGEFDKEFKLKSAIIHLDEFFNPLTKQFKNELASLKQAIECYYLPAGFLESLEEVYVPKYAKFAGMATLEIVSLVFPMNYALLRDESIDVAEYNLLVKDYHTLFVDKEFWSGSPSQGIPKRSPLRILNFMKNLRRLLNFNSGDFDGEFIHFHAICEQSLNEYSLVGKLKDTYFPIKYPAGLRYSRVNNSMTLISKPTHKELVYDRISPRRDQSLSIQSMFGSFSYPGGTNPPIEVQGSYINSDTSSSTDTPDINRRYDPVDHWHSTRGDSMSFGVKDSVLGAVAYEMDGTNSMVERPPVVTTEPGMYLHQNDRNGANLVYVFDSSYSNVEDNVVNMKINPYRWFTAFEQTKYLRIVYSGFKLDNVPVFVDLAGEKLPDVTEIVEIIGDSELVACSFDINVGFYDYGDLVSSIWRSPSLVAKIAADPEGPTNWNRTIN